MQYILRILSILMIATIIVSCKGDTNEKKETSAEIVKEKLQEKVDAQSEEVKNQINSVMTKCMVTPELKTFTSALVTAGITDFLSKQEGPFTILAPSNDAFNAVDAQKLNAIINSENKSRLIALLKTHIVSGSFDSADLVQNIKKGTGNYALETLSGAKITASLNGTDIVIKDTNGNEAVLGKSDINGSNGVVHVIGAVLGVN